MSEQHLKDFSRGDDFGREKKSRLFWREKESWKIAKSDKPQDRTKNVLLRQSQKIKSAFTAVPDCRKRTLFVLS
jgi:hypothetical protein